MRTRIKFCGITNKADALAAVDLGVDALGFVMSQSPRQISRQKAAEIIKLLPPMITTIGVFVNEQASHVEYISGFCKFNVIQLQGNEDLDQYSWRYPMIKAYKIGDDNNFNPKDIDPRILACLFDTMHKDKTGGTGVSFDWQKIANCNLPKPMILAGGLNSNNVVEAIQLLKPYAVDISSGIEKEKGIKDYKLMEEFVKQVKVADQII